MATRFVLFANGGQRYALPVDRVREVVGWQQPRALGAAEPWLLGVIALRGELLQVADLALRLGNERGAPRQIVVFDGPDGKAGLAVDAVDTVVDVEESALTPAPAGSRDIVEKIAVVGSELVVVLDADGLLGPKPPEPEPKPAPKPRRARAAKPKPEPGPKPASRRRATPRRKPDSG